jgi:hypothetical protein
MNKTKFIRAVVAAGPGTANAGGAAPNRAPAYRRLKWDELVSRGDFVENDRHGFEPWDGPSGFRADAFVKPIYRKCGRLPVATEK